MDKVKQVTRLPESPVTPENLLKLAVESNQSIENLQALMSLYDRWKADKAKAEFNRALAQFQSTVKKIVKDKVVKYRDVNFRYASLGEIMLTIKPELADAGLSVRWRNEDKDGRLVVTCIVTHIDGHSIESTMGGMPDTSGSKNNIQATGSTLTYLQRYTLSLALGIVTEDDTDGDGGAHTDTAKQAPTAVNKPTTATKPEPAPSTTKKGKDVPNAKQWDVIKKRLMEGTATLENIEKFFDITEEQRNQLINQVKPKQEEEL
jgi:hypothetical protein